MGREWGHNSGSISHAKELTMAGNSPLPIPSELMPVKGIEIGLAEAGIKKPGPKDVLVNFS